MNTVEHSEILKEVFKDLHFGTVIQNNDTGKQRRVKVRVKGVYDEPIKKEHIPWALPLGDGKVPTLGDEVPVLFIRGDHERPVYFGKDFVGSTRIEALIEIYQKIIDIKKASAKKSVSVDTVSFDEPDTESVADFSYFKDVDIIAEDVATENGENVNVGSPSKGMMVEKSLEKDKELYSFFHNSGTFIEVQKDGTLIIHGVKEAYHITEDNKKELIEGNYLMKVDGDFTIHTIGTMKIKAGTFILDGTVTPGTGPLNCLPNCLFSGGVHAGSTVTGI